MIENEKMTPEEALSALRNLANSKDREGAHIEADGVLCALLRFLGHDELAIAFEDIGKWYG